MRAMVVGATGGLGAAIVRRLAADGAAVAACGRNRERLQHLVTGAPVAGGGKPVLAVPLDLEQPDDIPHVVESAVTALGGLDVLVNCAAQVADGRFETVGRGDWERSFAVKFFGALDLIRAALPYLKRSGQGVVVTLSGMRARAPLPGSVIAGAINAAIENTMKALALDFAAHGIRVLALSPGPFDTPRLEAIFSAYARAEGGASGDVRRRESAKMPLARFGEPHELAELVAFLVSERARFITGTTIAIDGASAPGV